MQVVVIGGGVVGLWSARSLLQAGLSVTVLDRPAETSVATPASAGWVVPGLSHPLSGPGVLRHTAGQVLRREAAFSVVPSASVGLWLWRFLRAGRAQTFRSGLEATLALAAVAGAAYEELHDADDTFERHEDGLLLLARTASGLDHAVDLARTAESAGYRGKYEVLDAAALAERDPALSPAAGAVHLLDGSHVRPEQLHAALRSEVERLGGTLREQQARRIGRSSDGWDIATGNDVLRADKVVLAAGYWSGALLARLGVRVPLQTGAGVSVTAGPADAGPRYPMKLVEADVAVTPFGDSVRVAGRFALGSRPRAPRRRTLKRLLDAAQPYLREWRPASARLERVGLRPATPDSLPLIGEPHGQPGLVVATGHGMLGLTLAPGTAAEVTHQIVHGAPTEGGAAFDPNRFR